MTDDDPSQADSEDRSDREKGPDEVYCTNCGAVISRKAEICPECGVRQQSPAGATGASTDQEKDPGIAAVLSFFVSGLGQIYNGEIGKGIAFMVVQLVNFALVFVLVGFLTLPAVWLFAIYDAYKSAERINEREARTE